jgi:hypothetical protein
LWLNAALAVMLILIATGQPSSVGSTASFPAVLAGGSKGVPSNLSGTVSVSDTRIEFEAFPQIEYMELPCATIKAADYPRRHKNLVTIVSADSTYRFDLRSESQARLFLAGVLSHCNDLPKSQVSAQK